jgi:hypothetical protein
MHTNKCPLYLLEVDCASTDLYEGQEKHRPSKFSRAGNGLDGLQNQQGPVGLGGGRFCLGPPSPPSLRRFLASASVIGAFMS